ncbi:MAG: hypothetical protein V9G14_14455 [Cypionkella sp.]
MRNRASRVISGLIKPGDIPPKGGLYLMDVVPDGEVRFGFPNISDNAEIVEMMASGAHLHAVCHRARVGGRLGPCPGDQDLPPIPYMYARLTEDMDINAGRMLDGEATLEEVGQEIFDLVISLAIGRAQTKSEELGHAGIHPDLQEF